MSTRKRFVPVVAVLNMKGGVGKTTISAHVFRVLFGRRRAGTLLVDLDPQFNLTQTLLKKGAYDTVKGDGETIISVMESPPNLSLFDVNTTTAPLPPLDELLFPFYYIPKTDPIERLDLIPGDFGLVKYSLMDDNRKLLGVRRRFLDFINSAKNNYKVICIDCNPSSSFLTLCALHACTHILVPVRPDKYSILGLEILADFVESLPTISPKPQFIVALNGMPRSPRSDATAVEAELRGHPKFGSLTLAAVIHETSLLRARTDYSKRSGGPV